MSFKNTCGLFQHISRLLLSGTLLFFVAPLWAQDTAPDPGAENAALWADGVAKIVHGQFSEARASLARILENNPGDESYLQIASWLDRRTAADATRADLHAKQREQYLKLAKKRVGKEKWGEALSYILRAKECALQETAFMREPWAQALHDKVVAQARQHEQEGQWAKASGLYYELKTLFEGNREYQRKFEECILHSRLQAIYNEESKWKSRLQSVTPRIVQDTLWLIHNKYVVEPDFKKSAKVGLQRLRLLAESDSLAELFLTLKNEDNRRQYVRRLNRLIKKVDRQEDYSYKDLDDAFERVLKINEQTIELDRELIIYEFLEGVLDDAGSLDQFTSMIWPVEYSDFEKHTRGRFPGVGIQIAMQDGRLTVVSPLEDTPAYRAGIQTGDKITHIDGESTEELTLTGAVQTITGPVGTKVVLTIRRPRTKQSFDVELIREEIRIQSVKGYRRRVDSKKWDFMFDPEFGIAYVRVTNFGENTVSELREALGEIQKQKAQGLILDLRFNPGGLLQAAIEVSEMFLPDDSLIVTTDGRRSDPYSRSSRSSDKHYKLPMVVLVNEHSASASEIVSGALRDHQRAIVVGERTFGKGSVQNLIPVGHGNGRLKLTTAQYYLPSGRSIHKMPDSDTWGVEPDIEVTLVPRERGKIRTMNREADVIRSDDADQESEQRGAASTADEAPPADQEKQEQPAAGDKSDLEEPGDEVEVETAQDESEPEEFIEYPDVDYQLETAALVLRVQLLERLGFGILSKVKLGKNTSSGQQPVAVTN